MITKKKFKGEKILLQCLNKKNISPNYPRWLIDKNINKYLEVRFQNKNELKKKYFSKINFYNKSKSIILFGIFYNNEHIGNIKIDNNKLHRRAEIGLLIGNKNFWGKGFGTEAIRLASKFAFKYFKCEILFAGSYRSNISSINSFKKAGWKINCVFKKYWKLNKGREDWVLLSKVN